MSHNSKSLMYEQQYYDKQQASHGGQELLQNIVKLWQFLDNSLTKSKMKQLVGAELLI